MGVIGKESQLTNWIFRNEKGLYANNKHVLWYHYLNVF